MAIQLPWVASGGTPCCCDGGSCYTVPRSLCAVIDDADICGFPEFDPDGAEAISCPPKYYRTKTTQVVRSVVKSGTCTTTIPAGTYGPDDPGDSFYTTWDYTYGGTITTVERKAPNAEGVCESTFECSGSDSGNGHTFGTLQQANGGGTFDLDQVDYTNNWENCADGTCGFVWTETFEGETYSGCNTDVSSDSVEPFQNMDSISSENSVDTDKTTRVTTVVEVLSRACGGALVSGTLSFTRSVVTTETLSDEIPYSEMMRNKVCAEDQCFETEEDPDCRYCSTPFCGTNVENTNRDGLKWEVPDSPVGCIKPSATNMTWMIDGCSGGDLSVRTTDLTLVAKDLTPGQWYRLDVTYLHCFFSSYPPDYPVVGLRGTFIDPTCFSIGSCAEGSYASTTDTIEFQADHWAEVLSNFCDHCEIMYLVCQLKDEAKAWNDANPLETPRTVDCSAGGFQMPVLSNNYTWVESCSVTEIDPPA